jgi:Icc-related predicted phosphoesterase
LTKIWTISDLHLDVNRRWGLSFKDGDVPTYDVMVIAGDVMEGACNAINWVVDQGLNKKPVVMVWGNHTFYGGRDIVDEQARGLKLASTYKNIHILDDVSIDLDGVMFVGGALWTDYNLYQNEFAGMKAASSGMNDHMGSIINGNRNWSTLDARAAHWLTREVIEKKLVRAAKAGKTAVVVTHHAPSVRSIHKKYAGDMLNAGYASDLEYLMIGHEAPALWIHGHVHSRFDYKINKTRVVCNPRGYIQYNEALDFDSHLVIEV